MAYPRHLMGPLMLMDGVIFWGSHTVALLREWSELAREGCGLLELHTEAAGAQFWVNFSLAASEPGYTSLSLDYIVPGFPSDLIAKFTLHLPIHGKWGTRQAACLSFLTVRLLGPQFWVERSNGTPLRSHCWNPALSQWLSVDPSHPTCISVGFWYMACTARGRRDYNFKIPSL